MRFGAEQRRGWENTPASLFPWSIFTLEMPGGREADAREACRYILQFCVVTARVTIFSEAFNTAFQSKNDLEKADASALALHLLKNIEKNK